MINQISNGIERYLIKRGITFSELARKLGVSRQRVSYMILSKENDNWKISNLKDIAKALGVDLKSFLMEVIFNEE